MNEHHVTLKQIAVEKKTKDGLRRGVVRRELKNRGNGMKGRVDKSIGIVTLITSGNSPVKILDSRYECQKTRRTKSS